LAKQRDNEHSCEWRSEADELKTKLAAAEQEIADLKEKLEAIQKKVFDKSSEKMPPMDREVRRGSSPDLAARTAKRRKNAETRAEQVETEDINVPVPPDLLKCPVCANGGTFREVGSGTPSSVWEYVPGYFRRRCFHRQTMACTCGQHIVTAPVPDKVFDRTQYGPRFIAWLVVSKCCDAIPIYRFEKMFQRMGIPMSRSTMTRLFNRAGELLIVLASAILERIAKAGLVLADETPQRLQNGSRGYMWTFIAGNLVAYQFSLSRSGDTPKRILGGTEGTLVVDMYTGYNAVTGTGQRERAGCLAHVRRKFFDAKKNTPQADVALELIREIYIIEARVKQENLLGSPEHADVRMKQILPYLDRLYIWLAEQKDRHRPKSKMGKAIRYAMRNWQALTRFILDPEVPPDNNRSENALRIVALLRKNSLFAHDPDTADNLAALLTVVATCVASDIDPLKYLTDVLPRITDTPDEELASLIPGEWVPLAVESPSLPG
jgi:transposase